MSCPAAARWPISARVQGSRHDGGCKPNAAMRSAAIATEGFVSGEGSAEATGLPDACTMPLFAPPRWIGSRPVILRWNIRGPSAYEKSIAEFATDDQTKWDDGSGQLVDEFFGVGQYLEVSAENIQLLDSKGLWAVRFQHPTCQCRTIRAASRCGLCSMRRRMVCAVRA
jgi:hypothetical protein